MSNTQYTLLITFTDGTWSATVEGLRGSRVEARSLQSLYERAHDAIASLGHPRGELLCQYPGEIIRPILAADTARNKAMQAEEAAQARAAEVARELNAKGVSYRDLAELLHLSHQRVVQLAATARTYPDGSARRHEDDDGEMDETSRRHGGTIRVNNGPAQYVEHVFGQCKRCGAVGRWNETTGRSPGIVQR